MYYGLALTQGQTVALLATEASNNSICKYVTRLLEMVDSEMVCANDIDLKKACNLLCLQ